MRGDFGSYTMPTISFKNPVSVHFQQNGGQKDMVKQVFQESWILLSN
jgi:hypothetical protein